MGCNILIGESTSDQYQASLLALSSNSGLSSHSPITNKNSSNQNQEISMLLNQAHVAFEKNQFNLAKQYYIYIIQLDENNTDAMDGLKYIEEQKSKRSNKQWRREEIKRLLHYGQDASSKKKFESARDYYFQVIKLEPTHEGAKEALILIDQTEQAYDQEMKKQKKIDELFQMALDSSQNQNYESAVSYYQTIVNMEPSNGTAQKSLIDTQFVLEQKKQALLVRGEIEKKMIEVNESMQNKNFEVAFSAVQYILAKDPFHSKAKKLKSEIELVLKKENEITILKQLKNQGEIEKNKELNKVYKIERLLFKKNLNVFYDLHQQRQILQPGVYTLEIKFKNDIRSMMKDQKYPNCYWIKKNSDQKIFIEPAKSLLKSDGWVNDKMWIGECHIDSDQIEKNSGLYNLFFDIGYSLTEIKNLKSLQLGNNFIWEGSIKIHTTHLPYGKSLESNHEDLHINLNLRFENRRGRERMMEMGNVSFEEEDRSDLKDRFELRNLYNKDYRDFWVNRDILLVPFGIDINCIHETAYQWNSNEITDRQEYNTKWDMGLKWNGNHYQTQKIIKNEKPFQISLWMTNISPKEVIEINANQPEMYQHLFESQSDKSKHLSSYQQGQPWRFFLEIDKEFIIDQLNIHELPWDEDEMQLPSIYLSGYASEDGSMIQTTKKYSFYGGHDTIEIEVDLRAI